MKQDTDRTYSITKKDLNSYDLESVVIIQHKKSKFKINLIFSCIACYYNAKFNK